jgi:4-alpha-glucanotransferase
MKLERSSGILLHITSLAGRHGIGTLGPEAKAFADTLKAAGHRYWQILPIGPVDGALGYSPYSSSSTFAGSWLMISLEKLADNKWFKGDAGAAIPETEFVDFNLVERHKIPILKKACDDFFSVAGADEKREYKRFCKSESYWLDDFSMFSSIAEETGTRNWLEWDTGLSRREPKALERKAGMLSDRIRFHKFLQYVFFTQWAEWKQYCNGMGVRIIGDIPIYVTLESADAWANPGILLLDKKTGHPVSVAGVPPDYFSETGQRWGNPVYRWRKGRGPNSAAYRWWVRRIAHLHKLVDLIRIDHFRGFEAFWAIPAEEKTAVRGKWVKGPGERLFHTIRRRLGRLPLIAEDLGLITPEVERLRDGLELPGMKILQFAFDFNNKNYYLPHNIINRNCILYTGTHDNNTTNGWFYEGEIDDHTRSYILEYLGVEDFSDFHWKLIRQAYRSAADVVIIPAQDILGYGEEFRMNRPGTTEGNWRWKLVSGLITEDIVGRLRRMGHLYDRIRDEG